MWSSQGHGVVLVALDGTRMSSGVNEVLEPHALAFGATPAAVGGPPSLRRSPADPAVHR